MLSDLIQYGKEKHPAFRAHCDRRDALDAEQLPSHLKCWTPRCFANGPAMQLVVLEWHAGPWFVGGPHVFDKAAPILYIFSPEAVLGFAGWRSEQFRDENAYVLAS